MTGDQARIQALAAFISEARWFGGKGREFEVTEVRELPLADDVTTTLVTVSYANGDTDLYQVPISTYDDPQERLGHALIGEWDDRFHYDAAHDRDAMQRWLAAFASATTSSPNGAFHRAEDRELDLRRWEGVVPIELLGGVHFPQIGELSYLLTLGGYGFYWIRLPEPEDGETDDA